MPTQAELIEAISDATRIAVTQLFREHPGRFYYCVLFTTGDAQPPFLSAWSEEALDAAAHAAADRRVARSELRWSYADSPFCTFGEVHYARVRSLFASRPAMDHVEDDDLWQAEWRLRLNAMEAAMARLDAEGVFGRGAARASIMINVEVVPPESSNTERAVRLNPPEAVAAWLAEAAEA